MVPEVIIGIDEAGCGALAGPLLVAATAFAEGCEPVKCSYTTLRGAKELVATDSKSFSRPEHREALANAIRQQALAFSVIERTSKEIDDRLIHNVLAEAIRLAASRVIERLAPLYKDPSQFLVLLDGQFYAPSDIPCPVRAIPHGDALVWQIGAASLLAKTTRDQRMQHYAEKYPRYGFDKHKGYPVAEHKDRLKMYGACPIHRESYRPVRALRPQALGFEE
jgi:ribonuclease HII